MKKTNLVRQTSTVFIAKAPTACRAALRCHANLLKACLSLLLLSVIADRVGAANLVANGGFEVPVVSDPYKSYSSQPPSEFVWTLESGSLDHVGSLWLDAEGSQSIDLNGTGPGTIYQNVTTTPGERYRIRFAYAGNPDPQFCPAGIKVFNVFWGDAGTPPPLIATVEFNTQGRSFSDMGWQYYEVEVTASSSLSRLRFQSTTTGFCGPTLDDISVTELDTIRLATAQWTPLPTGWVAYPFLNGGGSQNVISTTSSISTEGWQDPAPPAVYQHLQVEGASLTWAVVNLSPLARYKIRVHFSSIEIPEWQDISLYVWVSNGGSADFQSGVNPYAFGFNRAMIVELYHLASPSGQLQGGIDPETWLGAANAASVSGVEILEQP